MIDKFNKQFIDTNVLVYAHDVTAGKKHVIAKKLIEDLWNKQNGCLSTQVLQEFYVTITKKVAKPVASEFASGIIADLGNWELHVPDVDSIVEAINIQQRHNLSFWDSLIICSASSLKCDVIWSEDLSSGQYYESILLLNPFI